MKSLTKLHRWIMDVLSNMRQRELLNQHYVGYYHVTHIQGKLDID